MAPTTLDHDLNPYASFWMAGFEGADHVNARAEPQDLVRMTGHLAHLDDDYRRVAAFGLRTIRESVGWRLTEPTGAAAASSGRFDFSRTLRCADAANRHGLQVLWTLMHYGFPSGVDVFADDFAERFADFAAASARILRGMSDRAPVYTPINEISFLAWAIAESDFIHPYRQESKRRQGLEGHHRDVGWEAKRRLIRAALLAIEAIRAEDPRARILHVEPLTHVVPPPHAPHLAWRADEIDDYQWQAWDMLSGALMPELGGKPEALDLLGVNYYHNCQWEMETGQRLEWHLDDPRRVSLASLLRKTSKRYGKPLVISETSHVGVGRALWLDDVSQEVERAMRGGVPVLGVCLYPIIDRPDWNDFAHWHNSGMWDVDNSLGAPEAMTRRIHLGYAKSLRRAQARMAECEVAPTVRPHLVVFSRLRWDLVDQRPQHLLSRMARHYDVVFVEEPSFTTERAYLERSAPCPGIEVLRPHTPIDAAGFADAQLATLQVLLAGYLADNLIDDHVVWYDTPALLPMLDGLAPRAVERLPELVAELATPSRSLNPAHVGSPSGATQSAWPDAVIL